MQWQQGMQSAGSRLESKCWRHLNAVRTLCLPPAKPAKPSPKSRAGTIQREPQRYAGKNARGRQNRALSPRAARLSTRILVSSSLDKFISHAIDREHVLRVSRIRLNLSSQVLHMHIDGTVEGFRLQSPNCVQQLCTREDAPRLASECGQQLKFCRRQFDAAILDRRLHSRPV